MPKDISIRPELAEILKFRPFPIPDPVPPYLIQHLDLKQLAGLAAIELEMRNEIIEATLKANTQAMELVRRLAK
jgi:hypothetical protein